jgi:hypothetical protein
MNTAIDMNGNDVADARDISATRWIASSGGVLTNGDIMTTNGSVYATNGHIVSNDGFLTGVTLPSGAIARLSQGIFYAEVVPNGTAIPKPTNCPSGSPQIFASAVSMSTNPPRSYYAVSLVDASGVSSEWRPTLYLYTSGGWVVGHTAYTNLNVWVKCS